ncbi:MAG: hypothetical protein JWR75_1682 [Devosia sp.]|nr:hypothetical protein [Devosia sp.]
MQRYYFDYDDGLSVVVDATGTELDDVGAAQREAIDTLTHIACETMPRLGIGTLSMRVRNADGKQVLDVGLRLLVTRTEG